MKEYDVMIIGGGASGLASAISSARKGAKTAIAERLPRVGKKLLVTGNGRCNFSNASLKRKNYHGTNSAFVGYVFSQFNGSQIVEFLMSLESCLRRKKTDVSFRDVTRQVQFSMCFDMNAIG